MKEGAWINYSNQRSFPIDLRGTDHERWIREPDNAKRIGVPAKVIRALLDFKPVRDRERLLLFVMQHAPVMRVRGHGPAVTFEFWTVKNDGAAKQAVRRFARRFLGPWTELRVVNLARIQRHT